MGKNLALIPGLLYLRVFIACSMPERREKARFAHSWLVNKIIAFSVSLHLLYMVKHKVLLDKRS